jgi:arylsulfatase A-like enzyme
MPRHPAADVTDSALELLRRGGGLDHFAFVHFIDVHWPYDPPDGFIERFRETKPDVDYLARKVLRDEPPDGPDETQKIIDLYDAELAYTDREVGRLFDELKKMNLYDRSLIILTGDHGESFYEHGRWQHVTSLYDEVIHIPLIVKWPGNSVTGRVATPVSQASIFSTILEQAGGDPPHSAAASLRREVGGGERAGKRRPVVSEFTTIAAPNSGATKVIAFRSEDRKYIVTFRTKRGDLLAIDEILDEELYDLTRDPGETSNLLDDTSIDMGDFHRELKAYLDEARELEANRMGESVIMDETTRKRLEELGYVTR